MLIETDRHEPRCPIPVPLRDEHGNIHKFVNYFFYPSDPTNTDSPHVADVVHKDHLKYFLSVDNYAIYDGPAPKMIITPVTSGQMMSADAAGRMKNHPTPVPYSAEPEIKRAPGPEAAFRPLDEVVAELRVLGTDRLRTAMASGKYTSYQVQAALDDEKKRQDAPPRNSWMEVCEYFIKGREEK